MKVVAENVSLTYGEPGNEVHACLDINLTVNKGEFVGILGPSGSGKSSLLYLLSGLKTPTSGRVFVDDKNLSQMTDAERAAIRLKTFGFVFQQPYLLGYLNTLENTLLGVDITLADAGADLLRSIGLGEKMHRRPHELSGGERQRVCVARSLVSKPSVIFADEPTAALDHTTGRQVVELLNRHRGDGTLVMVTHDKSMLDGADRILEMVDGKLI